MYDSKLLQIDFYFFRLFKSNRTISVQFTHIYLGQQMLPRTLSKQSIYYLFLRSIYNRNRSFSCLPLTMHHDNAQDLLLNVLKHITKYMLPFSSMLKPPQNVKSFDLFLRQLLKISSNNLVQSSNKCFVSVSFLLEHNLIP